MRMQTEISPPGEQAMVQDLFKARWWGSRGRLELPLHVLSLFSDEIEDFDTLTIMGTNLKGI